MDPPPLTPAAPWLLRCVPCRPGAGATPFDYAPWLYDDITAVYPRAFAYARAAGLDEALDLLAEHGEESCVLAGGMSLVPQMKYRLRAPRVLIDIGRLRELAGIETADGELRIGALTRHADAAAWEGPPPLRIVPELAGRIGDRQVRSMGTVGGALAAVEPTGDWGPALLALRGEVVAARRGGERRIAADDLCVGTHRSSLQAGELLTRVVVRLPSGRFGTAQARFEARAGAAFMSAAACVALDDGGRVEQAGVACGGLDDVPVRMAEAEALLRGERPDAERLEQAAASVGEARAGFRASVARRLVREALGEAVARAGVAV